MTAIDRNPASAASPPEEWVAVSRRRMRLGPFGKALLVAAMIVGAYLLGNTLTPGPAGCSTSAGARHASGASTGDIMADNAPQDSPCIPSDAGDSRLP